MEWGSSLVHPSASPGSHPDAFFSVFLSIGEGVLTPGAEQGL